LDLGLGCAKVIGLPQTDHRCSAKWLQTDIETDIKNHELYFFSYL
jgi:hypothetical protein